MAVLLKSQLLIVAVLLAFCPESRATPDINSLFDEGIFEFKQGRYQKAIDLYTEIILVAPENARAYKNRGVALMKLGKIRFAIRDFTTAIKIDPEMEGLHGNLGAAWHFSGEYARAIANYDIAVKLRPNDYINYFNRALSHAGAGDYEAALEDIESVLSGHPDFQPALSAEEEIYKRLAKEPNDTYCVQTGAYLVESNAVEMKQKLAALGYDTTVVVLKDGKQRDWYLVRSGRGLRLEEAKKIKEKLIKGHIEAVIRPEGKF